MKDEKYYEIKNCQMNRSTYLQWLDCAKGFAILAVLVIHSYNILYTDIKIIRAVDWALSLFVIVTGMGSYISNSHTDLTWGQAYYKSIKKILGAYLICSVICQVIKTRGFNFYEYIYQIVHFNASGPLYYVALHLQLMLVSWPLYRLLQRCPRNKSGYLQELVLFVSVSCIASVTTNYTQISDIYGGGGKVLGGTYLMLLYWGMLMMKHTWFDKESIYKSSIIWIISTIMWLLLANRLVEIKMLIDSKLPFGDGFNTPSMVSMLYGVCTLFLIYSTCKLLEKNKITAMIIGIVSWLGKHSLYIFMYHAVILYFLIMPYIMIENIWLKRSAYVSLMIILPIGIEYIVKLSTSFVHRVHKKYMRKA